MKYLFVPLALFLCIKVNASCFRPIQTYFYDLQIENVLTITPNGSNSHFVAWQPISGNGYYTLTIENLSTDQGTIQKITATNSVLVHGLVSGTLYRFKVAKADGIIIDEIVVQ